MKTCQYDFPHIAAQWATTRETHAAVAAALHAIAHASRSPEAIWADPTSAEIEHVRKAVAGYVRDGLIDPDADGRYEWGCETLLVEALIAERMDDAMTVRDTAGGRWWPSHDAQAEIDAATNPEETATRICATEPMRGVWRH